jgi:hypothetical protein
LHFPGEESYEIARMLYNPCSKSNGKPSKYSSIKNTKLSKPAGLGYNGDSYAAT